MESNENREANSCVKDEVLVRFFNGDVEDNQEKLIQAHLDQCDLCLLKLRQFAFIESQLNETKNRKVPRKLIQMVTDSLTVKETENMSNSVAGVVSIVVQFIKDGIAILEESVLPQNVKLVIQGKPQPALLFRGKTDTKDSEVAFEQTFSDNNIVARVTLKKVEDDKANIHINLKKFETPVSRTRVSIKQKGLIIYSKATNDNGSVSFSPIKSGQYAIWILAQKIEWLIDIRV